jgi:hypothetical protein
MINSATLRSHTYAAPLKSLSLEPLLADKM